MLKYLDLNHFPEKQKNKLLRNKALNIHRLSFTSFAHARAYTYTRIMLSAFFAVCVFAGSAFAQSVSSSYRMDYGRTVPDAGAKQSSSYKLIGALTTISADGMSSSYNLRNVYAGTPTGVPICGNAIIEGAEQCEGTNFNGLTCASFGYAFGNLLCSTCLIDTSGCYNTGGGSEMCGNGIKEAGEQCDDGNLKSGDGCSAGCRLENWKCGNGIREGAEECDDGNTNTGDGCTPTCKLEFTPPAPVCGNGAKEMSEECDDGNLTNGDGCAATCKLEVKEEEKGEKGLEFDVSFEEKPFYIIQPKPVTVIPRELRPAAPEQINEQFHFEDYTVGGIITILDETPLIVTRLDADAFYEITVLDKNGEEVGRQGGQADNSGILKIEILPYLNYDSYKIRILDVKHELAKEFGVIIEDSQYRLHESLSLDGEVQRDTICLGKIEKKDNLFMDGKGKPGTKYFAYFQSLGTPLKEHVNPVTVVKVTADTEGNYRLPIPENLKAGSYHLDVVQVYEDEKVSRNVRYVFELTGGLKWPCAWIIIFILAMTIAGQWNRFKPWLTRKSSLSYKFRHGFSVRILATIMAIFVIGQQSSPALATTTTPGVFIYEGKLLNPSNAPIITSQTFRFSFWKSGDMVAGDVVAGAINVLAPNYGGWEEVQTVIPNTDGTFFFKLGSVTPLPNMLLANHQLLQVEIKPFGAPDTSYELMDPTGDNGADTDDRQTIASTPYTNNADFIDNAEVGTGAGNIAVLDPGGIWNVNLMPGGTNSDIFVLDNDDTSPANITLQFGNTLVAEFLKFDIINDWFELSNDLNLGGNQIKNFAIDNLAGPPAVPVTGQTYFNTTNNNTYIWNGTSWDLVAGTSVKEIVFNTDYADATPTPDGTGNRGTLYALFEDLGGTGKRTFYEFNTMEATLQDVDIAISYQLPLDFVSFTATPIRLTYMTTDGNIANAKVDMDMYDTTGTLVALTGASNLANGSWTIANVTIGGSPTFTAGQTITLRLKLSAKKPNFARVSSVVLEYNGR
jgi:cysteine-rich repeat protein